jgi:hypothetical protein
MQAASGCNSESNSDPILDSALNPDINPNLEDAITSICLDPSLRSMVAFDIETEGFNPFKERITAAAVHDGLGLCKVFVFKGEDQAEDAVLKEEFLSILDAAPRLCAFNGVRFDIPYIINHWGLDPARAHGWVLKTLDVFEACKLGLQQTFKLSQLLAVNNMESKTGSGAEAVVLARNKEWDKLGAYCLQDTRLTYLVTAQMSVALPIHSSARQLALDRSHVSMFRLW